MTTGSIIISPPPCFLMSQKTLFFLLSYDSSLGMGGGVHVAPLIPRSTSLQVFHFLQSTGVA